MATAWKLKSVAKQVPGYKHYMHLIPRAWQRCDGRQELLSKMLSDLWSHHFLFVCMYLLCPAPWREQTFEQKTFSQKTYKVSFIQVDCLDNSTAGAFSVVSQIWWFAQVSSGGSYATLPTTILHFWDQPFKGTVGAHLHWTKLLSLRERSDSRLYRLSSVCDSLCLAFPPSMPDLQCSFATL